MIELTTKSMTTPQTVSQKLADYTANYSYEQIPVAVRERAKYLMLDAIGIAYASTHYPFAHHMLSGIRSIAGSGTSNLIGLAEKLPLRDAVLMNALDHLAMRHLRIPHYQRYMDDLALFGDDLDALMDQRDALTDWLAVQRCLCLKAPDRIPASTSGTHLYLGAAVSRAGVEAGPRLRRRAAESVARADSEEKLAAMLASYRAAWTFG